MERLGIGAMYVVAAAAVLLGLAMLAGLEPGRTVEALAVIFVGVMSAIWTRASSRTPG